MGKYEIYDYDVWGNPDVGYGVNEVIKTGIIIYTDTSRASICKNLGLDNPYKIDVYYDDDVDVVCIEYYGKPYCELRYYANEDDAKEDF